MWAFFEDNCLNLIQVCLKVREQNFQPFALTNHNVCTTKPPDLINNVMELGSGDTLFSIKSSKGYAHLP